MNIKQLSTLEQIKQLQEVASRFDEIVREVNFYRAKYACEDAFPALNQIIINLKLRYADEMIAESTAKVTP